MKFFLSSILCLLFSILVAHPAYAIYDPLSFLNNNFGIHIISASDEEVSAASDLVNSSGGDWGYITVLIESKDKDERGSSANKDKWQKFFDSLRRHHLIPLIRLATKPESNFWQKPEDKEELSWASFLDSLNWPVKNRYVTIYNEPNHGAEWGNKVDAKEYAQILSKTITALKKKNEDFFVLNAGLDASAPQKLPDFEDEIKFLSEMNIAVPGIFSQLDGWVSHSYPNPNFSGTPRDQGRGTINTWIWEKEILSRLGLTKNLPVFITETGWKHIEGQRFDDSLPDAETVAKYFKNAFEKNWIDKQIVAVTPFLLNYQEPPFEHFSFKKITGEKQLKKDVSVGKQVLGVQYSDYYPQYQAVKSLPKINGRPMQEDKAELTKGEIYSSLVEGESYTISLIAKNTGQSIWNDYEPVILKVLSADKKMGIYDIAIPYDTKIEPGENYAFVLRIKAPTPGTYKTILNLSRGNQIFSSAPFEFTFEVKSPALIKVRANLKWKSNFTGVYLLNAIGGLGNSLSKIILDYKGVSLESETKNLLPDYNYNFTLERRYYKPKTIQQKIHSGLNLLDFGELEPDIPSAILHPKEIWKLLPFSD